MRKLSFNDVRGMFAALSRGIFFTLLLVVSVSHSQETDKKEPAKKDVDLQNVQTPKTDTPLPKIDLPEFVITGSEKIDLHIESKSEDNEDRIFSPAQPTTGERPMNVGEALSPKQIKSFSKTPGALNGKVFAGFGFYQTPQFDGWFGQYDPTSSFVLNGYYSESQGHLNDAGFWRGGFGGRGTFTLPESSALIPFAQLSAETKYGRESYRSFASRSPYQVRDLSGLDVSGGIGSRYSLPYKSLSGFDYSGKLGWNTFSATDSSTSKETEFFISGSATTRFLTMSLRGQTEYRVIGYTMNISGISSHPGHWFVLRADGSQSVTPELQFSFALQQFIYRGNVGSASGRFYPQIELKYSFTENALLYYGYAPAIERNTLSSIIKQNKYINFNAQIVPTDTRVNLYGGMEYSPVDFITTTIKLSYKQINNFPTFYDKDSAKVWEVLYLSGVRSTKFDVSTAVRLNQKQNVSVYGSYQNVKQKDSSGVLPYTPKFTIGTVYHHFFDFGLHTEAFAEYNSSRFTNFANTHSNAGYLFAGVKADIELFQQFRGFAELNNLINQHYYVWNGYQERTIFLLLGVSYNW